MSDHDRISPTNISTEKDVFCLCHKHVTKKKIPHEELNISLMYNARGYQHSRSKQYAGLLSYMIFVMGLAHHRVSVAQW